jgi:large subunit ribosomal protein L6
MSRIGNRILEIPQGVTVTVADNTVTVKGPKGELNYTFDKNISVIVEENVVKTTRPNDLKQIKSLHGTTNAHIANMMTGVSTGFVKDLEITGVGYRCSVQGKTIDLSVGYSHPVKIEVPEGLTVTSNSNTELSIAGIDIQKVNEFAANVRKVRPPEPYKGKGIRYKDEHIRRKEGKKASK